MNMKALKSKGVLMTLIGLIFVVVSLITYGINMAQTGYFKGVAASHFVMFECLSILILSMSILYTTCPVEGTVEKVCDYVFDVLRVVCCVLIAFCLINYISSRVEGLGFIYFSNPDVKLEVQTPENLASSKTSIFNIIILAITLVVNIVSSFFNIKKSK